MHYTQARDCILNNDDEVSQANAFHAHTREPVVYFRRCGIRRPTTTTSTTAQTLVVANC